MADGRRAGCALAWTGGLRTFSRIADERRRTVGLSRASTQRRGPAVLSPALVPGAPGDGCRHRARRPLPRCRRADGAAWRRLHQGDPHADRAHHLLHGGARHCRDGQHGQGRARCAEGADLLRGADHDRACPRARRGQPVAARRRHERRSRPSRHGERGAVPRADPQPDRHAISARHHPEHLCRRVQRGKRAASALRLGAVRSGAERDGQGRRAAYRAHRCRRRKCSFASLPS